MRKTIQRVRRQWITKMEDGTQQIVPKGTRIIGTDELPEGEVRFNGRVMFHGMTPEKLREAEEVD